MRILKYIFLVMCIVPLTLMFLRMDEYQKEENTYNEIKRIVAEQRIRDGQKALPEWINPNDLIDFKGLLDKNHETVGYIRIDGTKIDYPVVRTEKDSDRYLNTGFNGDKSIYGTIFEDSAGGLNLTNNILHGHNMKNGSMFGSLKKFDDEKYTESYKLIKYITENTVYLYETVCFFTASGRNSKLLKNLVPYSKEEFEALKDTITANKGIFYGDMEWGEQYITLATCEYTHKSGQCYVIGKLIDKYRFMEMD